MESRTQLLGLANLNVRTIIDIGANQGRSTPNGHESPIFEEILMTLFELGFVYRGNIRCCWDHGVYLGADALFVRREVAGRLAS